MQLFQHQQKIINEDPNEIWRDVIGYEGLYQVSSFGNVLSIKRKKILKIRNTGDGYFAIVLCKNGIMKNKNIHRLVAETFILNKNDKPCVNHIDNDTSNNNVSNLEWVTYKENRVHCINQNRHNIGIKNFHSKLTESDIIAIRKSTFSTKDLSIIYKVTTRTIRDIIIRDTWKHI